MWKERAAKEVVMEFAQQRILHDQKRRRQQDERRRREKVSPRPFASGCWSSMRFARHIQRQSVLVELMLVRERKARPARKSALSHHRKFAESVLTLKSALLQLIGGAVTSVELSREVRANLFAACARVFFAER